MTGSNAGLINLLHAASTRMAVWSQTPRLYQEKLRDIGLVLHDHSSGINKNQTCLETPSVITLTLQDMCHSYAVPFQPSSHNRAYYILQEFIRIATSWQIVSSRALGLFTCRKNAYASLHELGYNVEEALGETLIATHSLCMKGRTVRGFLWTRNDDTILLLWVKEVEVVGLGVE